MRTANQRDDAVTRMSLAQQVTEQLLQVRRAYLKGRAPKSKYLHWLRRDMACGRVKNVEQLLALSAADVADGAPIAAVTAPYATIIALLELQAKDREVNRPAFELSLVPLHQRETRSEAELNEAQNWALAEPDNPEALAAVERAAASYEADESRLVAAVRRRRARLRWSQTVTT